MITLLDLGSEDSFSNLLALKQQQNPLNLEKERNQDDFLHYVELEIVENWARHLLLRTPGYFLKHYDYGILSHN